MNANRTSRRPRRMSGGRLEAPLARTCHGRKAIARPGNGVECREAVRVHASEGELVGALQSVFGAYVETPVF